MRKNPKVTRKAKKLEMPKELEILDEGEELDRVYSIFDVTDDNDIESIMSGSIGIDDE